MTHPEGAMMSADELRKLATDLRNDKDLVIDDAMMSRIKADIREYRRMFAARPEQVPFAPLDELLPLMGWVIYEASWDAVQKIPATLSEEATTQEQHQRGLAMLQLIIQLADAARSLPWPEFAPRALGAIRSQALAESKRDTEAGYYAASIAHKEGRRRYYEYRHSHEKGVVRDRFVRDLDEVVLQLDLAETGTACRTAERVICRWAEEFAQDKEQHWIERMFRELTTGVSVGEHAIDTARRIGETHGYVDGISEERLTMRTFLQNPGIMTARAASLLLALGPEMRRLGLEPVGFATWETWEEHVLSRFEKAYKAIEDPVMFDRNRRYGTPVELSRDRLRQLIHMRLNLALLRPGSRLPSTLSSESCLQYETLDAEALEILSEYLAGPEDSRGQERGIGAATMPSFIRSVIACRSHGPELDDRGYVQWRIRWFRLDRYAGDSDRWKNVIKALGTAHQQDPARPSPDVRAEQRPAG